MSTVLYSVRSNALNGTNLFESSYIVPVNLPVGQQDNGKYNTFAVYRTIPNYIYTQYKKDESSRGLGFKSGNAEYIIEQKYARQIFNRFVVGKDTFSNNDDESADLYNLNPALSINVADSVIDYWIDMTSGSIQLFKVTSDDTSRVSISNLRTHLKTLRLGILNNYGAADIAVFNDVQRFDSGLSRNFVNNNNTRILFWETNIEALSNSQLSLLTFGRLIKCFTVSSTLERVSQVLGISDGHDMSVYAPDIYYTYLLWYGIKTNSLTGEMSSDLNMDLLNPDAATEDISEITNAVPTEADMERETLKYSYLALHPTEGREYRNEIMTSKISSAMYTQYQKIVYGGSDTFYYSTVSTRNNTGFLAVQNYSENFMTSAFMERYTDVAIILIGVGVLLTVVIGIIRRRRASWVILSCSAIISVVLILPSSGEFVPYIANNLVQNIFEDKMTFWSISEQSTNEFKADQFEDTTDEQASKITEIVNSLKYLYLDRYLSVKQDISNKIMNSSGGNWEEIQSMKSVRWMLPTVLREFTNSEGTADYVYVPLGDKLDDCANLYFMLVPGAAEFSSAVTANRITVVSNSDNSEGSTTHALYEYNYNSSYANTANNPEQFYEGFQSPYTDGTEIVSWRANSLKNPEHTNAPHTFFYMINNDKDTESYLTVGKAINEVSRSTFRSISIWAETIANNLLTKYESDYSSDSPLEDLMISVGNSSDAAAQSYSVVDLANGTYNRYDRSTMRPVFGFLWATESPLHYFYENVCDSFDQSQTLASLALDLQGSYVTTDSNTSVTEDSTGETKEFRRTFMVNTDIEDTDPGYGEVKDYLDLQTLFENMLPYMYSMQLLAGGYDGEGGVFKSDDLIGDAYFTHKGMPKYWMFRSNWITKIMENDQYNCEYTIGLNDGTRVKIGNQLIPSFYTEAGRDMVFSRSQMLSQGLRDADLSLVELKCVELNNTVVKNWTLLLNYANVKGVSKDVFYGQMALEATMEFCKAFSPSGFTTFNHALYPSSLDLRSISFDSIMKLLMLNITKNSSYIYGDSMDVLIDDSDIFTQILLLVAAFLCAYILPMVRNVCLGLVFYMGFAVVIKTLFKDPREKVTQALGYTGCNVLECLLNIGYLLSIRLLIGITVSDQVLDISSDSISVGSPVICFIFLIALTLIYIVCNILLIKFCIVNFRDMGFAAFKGMIEMTTSNISSGFERIISKISSDPIIGDESSNYSRSSRYISDPVNQKYNRQMDSMNKVEKIELTSSSDSSRDEQLPDYHLDATYNHGGDQKYIDTDSDEIDRTIKRGKSNINASDTNHNESKEDTKNEKGE